MNFFKLNEILHEEINPEQSGVSEPANDKTVSNMLDMMKGLLNKVSNDALKNKIQKFIDDMTNTKPKQTEKSQDPSKSDESPKSPVDTSQPMPAAAALPSSPMTPDATSTEPRLVPPPPVSSSPTGA